MKNVIIAIDGPGASGKGTIGRRLAAELGCVYLDTGKIYRAVGYKMLQSGYDRELAENDNSKFVEKSIEVAKSLNMSELDNKNLAADDVAMMASLVSSIKEVRAVLLEFQRMVAKSESGAVLDGRDIGTVVCPDADLKFFITASVQERAKRRYKDLKSKNNGVIYDVVLQDLILRDERDAGRKASPMKPAESAKLIDTTNMSVDEAYKIILNIVGGLTPYTEV